MYRSRRNPRPALGLPQNAISQRLSPYTKSASASALVTYYSTSRVPVELCLSSGWSSQFAAHVEDCRLARTVGADERGDLPTGAASLEAATRRAAESHLQVDDSRPVMSERGSPALEAGGRWALHQSSSSQVTSVVREVMAV